MSLSRSLLVKSSSYKSLHEDVTSLILALSELFRFEVSLNLFGIFVFYHVLFFLTMQETLAEKNAWAGLLDSF
jgi:hypothetical protein